jgi:hypothetical protein
MKLRCAGKRVELEEGHLDLDLPVLDAIFVGDRVLVVHDYMVYPRRAPAPNLVAYSRTGQRIWTAENIGGFGEVDAYTNFISESPLTAHNFAGFRCLLDPETGKLLEKHFTK